MSVQVTSFYRFIPLDSEQVARIRSALESFAERTGLRGLCLLGNEGINSTLSGDLEVLNELKALVREHLKSPDLMFKDSVTSKHPFHNFRIKIKDEIVTLGRPDLAPKSPMNFHLSPQEWHQAMQDPDTIVLDTRNDYEVDIGKFEGAVDFKLKEFREFPEALKNSGIAKDKKVLIYCTGGIRCEKAILEMHEQGYSKVYQLDGGILNYIEKFPEQKFEGECFVFDYRVAVDQALQPTSKYKLCPHCGQPANQPLECIKCGTEAVICIACATAEQKACSKNCAHHVAIGSRSSKSHIQELTKRHKI